MAKGDLVLRAKFDGKDVAVGMRSLFGQMTKEQETAAKSSLRIQGQATREAIKNNELQSRSNQRIAAEKVKLDNQEAQSATKLAGEKKRLATEEARAISSVARAKKDVALADAATSRAQLANIRAVTAAEKELERQAKKRASDQAKKPTSNAWANMIYTTRMNVGGSSPLLGRTLAATGMDLKDKRTLALGTGIVAAGAAAPAIDKLKDVLQGALDVNLDFEKSMRNVNSTAQLSEAQFKKLNKQVIAIAKDKDIRSGPEELAKGLYDIYGSGKQGVEALEILKVSAKGASAGLTDASTSSTVLLATLNSGIKGVESPAQAMDVLFNIVDKGVMSFEQLATTIGGVLPIASQAGVSLQEVGTYLAIATRQGQSASEATNDLANLLNKLISPPKEAKDAFDKLGIAYGATELKAKGLGAKLQEIAQKTHGNADALKVLFPDMQAYRAILTSATNGGKAYRDMLGQISDKQEVNGKTAKALAEQNKSLAAQLELVKKEFKIIAVEVGPAFLRALSEALKAGKPFLKAIGDLADKFSKLSETEQQWVLGMAGVGFAVSGFLKNTLPLLTRLGEIKDAYVAIKAAATAANLAKFGLTATTGIVGGIALAAGYVAYENGQMSIRESNDSMYKTYQDNAPRIQTLKNDRAKYTREITEIQNNVKVRNSNGSLDAYMKAHNGDAPGIPERRAKIAEINRELGILAQQEKRNNNQKAAAAGVNMTMGLAMGQIGLNADGSPIVEPAPDTTDNSDVNPLAGWDPKAEKAAAAAKRKKDKAAQAAEKKRQAALATARKQASAARDKFARVEHRNDFNAFDTILDDMVRNGTVEDSVNMNRARPQAALRQSDKIYRMELDAAQKRYQRTLAQNAAIAKTNPAAAKELDAQAKLDLQATQELARQAEVKRRTKTIPAAIEKWHKREEKARETSAKKAEEAAKEAEKLADQTARDRQTGEEMWNNFFAATEEWAAQKQQNYREFLATEADTLQYAQEQALLAGKFTESQRLRLALYDNHSRQIGEAFAAEVKDAAGDPNAIAAAVNRRDLALAQARKQADYGVANDILGGTGDALRSGANDAVSQLFRNAANGQGNTLDQLESTFASLGQTAGNAFADYTTSRFINGPLNQWLDQAASKLAAGGERAGFSIMQGANALATVASIFAQQNSKKKSGGLIGAIVGAGIGYLTGGLGSVALGLSVGGQLGQGNVMGALMSYGMSTLGNPGSGGGVGWNKSGTTYNAGFYASGGTPPTGRMSIVGDHPEMAFTPDGRVTMLGLGGYQEYRPTGKSVVLPTETSQKLMAAAASMSGSGSDSERQTIINEGDTYILGDINDPYEMEKTRTTRERGRRVTRRVS